MVVKTALVMPAAKRSSDAAGVASAPLSALPLAPVAETPASKGEGLAETRVLGDLGPGNYPAPLPTCFTVTKDASVWENAVAAWRSRHATR